jgi:glyoxylase-like metal-dependent hydrolase (beta-lactamase superfamily II)
MKRTLLTIALALAATCLPAAAFAQSTTGPWVARTIAPSVHMLEIPPDYFAAAISNVGVIEQSDGFVVVDSGMTAGHGRTIVAYVRSLAPAKPIKAVVITHWHNDHPQGISAIRDAFPKVRIIATAATKAGMLGPEVGALAGLAPSAEVDEAARKEGAQALQQIDALIADPATPDDRRARLRKARGQWEELAGSWPGTYIVPPTETFTNRVNLPDKAVPVSIRFLGRANTAGDAVIWLPRQKVVFTGDVVVAPVPFGFFSYPADWIKTFGRIKALGFKTLIPGHGAPQTDASYIDKVSGSIEDIRAQVGPLARSGLPLEEVRKKVDFSRYEALFVTSPRFKPGFDHNWIEPMIENAFKEAKGVPIVQGEGEAQADPREKARQKKR